MDDIDLSHLLIESPVPDDGAKRARQSAIRRRKRQQMAGSAAAIIVVIGLGVGTIQFLDRPNDVVFQRDASHMTNTEPPTSTSTTATTTTIDSRKRYIGLSHTSRGSGLPVATSIVATGFRKDSPPRRGDAMYYWARDEGGDMVWIDHVTAYDAMTNTTTSTVAAVFAVEPISATQNLCLGTCIYTSTNNRDPNLIAVFQDSKVVRSWKADTTALTLTATARRDIAIAGEGTEPATEVTYPRPSRPSLYEVVALCKADACPWYDANEQVEVRGGGASAPELYVTILLDRKENKNVLVWVDGSVVRDVLIVDIDDGLPLPPREGFTYKGNPVNNLVVIKSGSSISRGWLMDVATRKFVEVSASDIAETK